MHVVFVREIFSSHVERRCFKVPIFVHTFCQVYFKLVVLKNEMSKVVVVFTILLLFPFGKELEPSFG